MRKKPYLIITLILAAVALAVALLYFWREANRDPLEDLVIPLYQQRPNTEAWDEIHDLSGSGDPLDARFQNIPGEPEREVLSTSTNADGVTVERVKVTVPWKQRQQEKFQHALEPIRLTAPDYSWQEGPVTLKVTQFLFQDYRLEADPDQNLKFLSQIALPKIAVDSHPAWQPKPDSWQPDYRPERPRTRLELDLKAEGVPGLRAIQQPVFDRRNRQQVCQSWGMSVNQGRTGANPTPPGISANFSIPANYDILPITTSDVFLGPAEARAWNPREQPVLETPRYRVYYLGAFSGTADNAQQDYRDQDKVFRVEFDQIAEPGHSVHLFAVNPQETQLRLNFEFGDIRRREENTGWLPAVRIFNLPIPEEELGEVQIKYYPHAKRIFTEPPILPVTPENRRLENGLDMRLPIVQIREQYDFIRIAAEALHVGYLVAGGPVTDPKFPLTYENITLRELLDEYLHYYPNHTITYDPVSADLKVQIRQDKPKPWDPAVEWVRDQLKKP